MSLILGAFAGVGAGVAITALRWFVVRRFTAPLPVPPSAEVLDAQRRQPIPNPLLDRRTR